MNTMELGQTMVEMVNQGAGGEAAFVSQYYADDTISVEGQGITPTGGERMQMDEVALFTVQDGKICKEEYLYRMG